MPKFVIEREIPDAGKFSPETLQAISQKSCGVLRELGPQIQWLHSYVTDDKIYCVYIAPDEATVRKHAEMGGFPANRISQVRTILIPPPANRHARTWLPPCSIRRELKMRQRQPVPPQFTDY